MSTVVTNNISSVGVRPQVLVVDDEPDLIEMIRDLVGPQLPCRFVAARNLDEARQVMTQQAVELLVADVHLPDGDGTSLVNELRQRHPGASAIVITGDPTIERAVTALRAGALDFLSKPFDVRQLTDHMRKALEHQATGAKREKRMQRLQNAVKRLSQARRVVSRKVDLLCNDLVTAYGELTRQLEDVRVQDSFRKYLAQAHDLEQVLCHVMDWMLRQFGYSNIAIWLAADDNDFQLGAYMKYTIAGERQLTQAMRNSLIPMTNRKGLVHLTADEAGEQLSPAELEFMADQSIMAISCTYLGEALGVITLFRPDSQPLTAEHAAALRSIAPIFAGILASIVKDGDNFAAQTPDEQGDDAEFSDGDDSTGEQTKNHRKRKKADDSDWWKRGEPPPF
ncbi:MAG: response regulator [Phycisphaerales bacterium]|nr:response regulator [Phycisphaerales bacterium]